MIMLDFKTMNVFINQTGFASMTGSDPDLSQQALQNWWSHVMWTGSSEAGIMQAQISHCKIMPNINNLMNKLTKLKTIFSRHCGYHILQKSNVNLHIDLNIVLKLTGIYHYLSIQVIYNEDCKLYLNCKFFKRYE